MKYIAIGSVDIRGNPVFLEVPEGAFEFYFKNEDIEVPNPENAIEVIRQKYLYGRKVDILPNLKIHMDHKYETNHEVKK